MDAERETVYVSGKAGDDRETRDFMARLEDLGFAVAVDWTSTGVRKPYLEYREHNEPLAEEMLCEAYDSDYFILLEHEGLLGARYEAGAALVAAVREGRNRIFVVGPEVRESAFYTLPNVEIVSDAEELFARLEKQKLNRVH